MTQQNPRPIHPPRHTPRRTAPSSSAGTQALAGKAYLFAAALGVLAAWQCIDAHPAQAAGMVQTIDGRSIEIRRVDPPHPKGTIVFENGSRKTLDSWDAVIAELGKEYRVFAYNRPGYGASAPATSPRDGRTIEQELHQTLKDQGLPPPYLLVGHSLGGLYVQMFARMYPDETQGVVLVDALYPGVIKKPDDFPFLTRTAKLVFLSTSVAAEIDHIHATGEAIDALPWRTDIPMVRLVNAPSHGFGIDLGVVDQRRETYVKIESMYPGSIKTIVDSDHNIQSENPEYVITAIRQVLQMRVH